MGSIRVSANIFLPFIFSISLPFLNSTSTVHGTHRPTINRYHGSQFGVSFTGIFPAFPMFVVLNFWHVGHLLTKFRMSLVHPCQVKCFNTLSSIRAWPVFIKLVWQQWSSSICKMLEVLVQ